MKKELYKLIIVFIMILISFCVAFFLGKEITLSNQEYSADILKTKKNVNKKSAQNILNNNIQNNSPTNTKKNVNKKSAQNILNNNIQNNSPTNTKKNVNKKSAQNVLNNNIQNNSPTNTKKNKYAPKLHVKEYVTKSTYGLFIAKYSTKQKASVKSIKLKIDFPKWNIFFKKSKGFYKVYVGPFYDRVNAKQFLKKIRKIKGFYKAKLKKI